MRVFSFYFLFFLFLFFPFRTCIYPSKHFLTRPFKLSVLRFVLYSASLLFSSLNQFRSQTLSPLTSASLMTTVPLCTTDPTPSPEEQDRLLCPTGAACTSDSARGYQRWVYLGYTQGQLTLFRSGLSLTSAQIQYSQCVNLLMSFFPLIYPTGIWIFVLIHYIYIWGLEMCFEYV